MRYLTKEAMIAIIRAECRDCSQKEYAKRHGLSEPYLSDFLNGRRDIRPAILRVLGLDPRPFYRKALKPKASK